MYSPEGKLCGQILTGEITWTDANQKFGTDGMVSIACVRTVS